MIYNAKSWQGNSGFNAAARTPHEAQMAGVIGSWRGIASGLCMLLIPLAAYTVLHLPKFAEMAAPIHAQIAAIADPHPNQLAGPTRNTGKESEVFVFADDSQVACDGVPPDYGVIGLH